MGGGRHHTHTAAEKQWSLDRRPLLLHDKRAARTEGPAPSASCCLSFDVLASAVQAGVGCREG